jgi:hypothetical protein
MAARFAWLMIRFHFMWEFLGLPWEDIRIVPKAEVKGKL